MWLRLAWSLMLINLLPEFFAVLDSTDRVAAYQRYFAAHRPLLDQAAVPPEVELVKGTLEDIAAADLIIVLTDHDDLPWDLLEQHADRVLDTRNRVRAAGVDRL